MTLYRSTKLPKQRKRPGEQKIHRNLIILLFLVILIGAAIFIIGFFLYRREAEFQGSLQEAKSPPCLAFRAARCGSDVTAVHADFSPQSARFTWLGSLADGLESSTSPASALGALFKGIL